MWTVACQASLFMGFPRQEYWSGLPSSPGDLPNPGIQPKSPALAAGFFTTEPPETFSLNMILLGVYWCHQWGALQNSRESNFTSFVWVVSFTFLMVSDLSSFLPSKIKVNSPRIWISQIGIKDEGMPVVINAHADRRQAIKKKGGRMWYIKG